VARALTRFDVDERQEHLVKIGLAFANTGPFADAAGARALGTAAEAAGIESVWTVEHVVFPDGYTSEYPYAEGGRMPMAPNTPLPDPLIWLTFVAATTERLRLGTGILILPERNPVVLAKEVATLDAMSDGRVELGIGVGWLREEFDALGIPWARRGARTDEYVAAMRALWDDDHASFDGEFVSFSGVSSNPKPADGRVPVVIGGHSRAAAERAGRLGDGFFPAKGDIAELVDIARQTAADAGRDPLALEMTGPGDALLGSDPVAAAEAGAAMGLDRMILPALLLWNDPMTAAAELAERVVRPVARVSR
jgi:probable F420-dependent oxidoreductase